VLRRPATPVADPDAPEIARLVQDMAETMADAGGVGLAAPQVHVGARLIVFRVPQARRQEGEPDAPEGVTALVNPSFEPLDEEMVLGLEGCLSIPGLRGMVPRHARIRYRGLTPDGRPLERLAEGFHARVVQHEIDHLDGVLFLDRMDDLRTLVFESELHHLVGGPDGPAD
jgi:peptide deformylase